MDLENRFSKFWVQCTKHPEQPFRELSEPKVFMIRGKEVKSWIVVSCPECSPPPNKFDLYPVEEPE